MTDPVKGKISSGFGTRVHPVTRVVSFHNGVDIAVSEGTPVLAPEVGTIIATWTHSKGGNSLAMITENETRYGFAHLKNFQVQRGDKVQEGEQIATSGNTGASTGAHLHFTVKKNDKWENPQHYFSFL